MDGQVSEYARAQLQRAVKETLHSMLVFQSEDDPDVPMHPPLVNGIQQVGFCRPRRTGQAAKGAAAFNRSSIINHRSKVELELV